MLYNIAILMWMISEKKMRTTKISETTDLGCFAL